MKIFKFLLLLSIIIFIGSCSIFQKGGSRSSKSSPVISRILKNNELRIGTTGVMPPLNMKLKDGSFTGFDIELAKLIAKDMGVKLKIKSYPFSKLLPSLRSGEIDIVISGMTITPKRNLKVFFIGPYYVSGKAFLTKMINIAKADKPSVANNTETKLIALESSTSQEYVEKNIPKATLIKVSSYAAAIDLLKNDKAHALVADFSYCIQASLLHKSAGLLAVAKPMTYEPLGIAIPLGDPLFANWLQNWMNTQHKNGTISKLENKWISSLMMF